jgi:hypothetical protein
MFQSHIKLFRQNLLKRNYRFSGTTTAKISNKNKTQVAANVQSASSVAKKVFSVSL